MSTAPGTRLGPYEIVSRIGAEGMGEVFRARDTRLAMYSVPDPQDYVIRLHYEFAPAMPD